MEVDRSSGQTFILGAILFSGLFVIASIPAGPALMGGDEGTSLQSFFQQSLSKNVEAFNEQLSENKSIKEVKRSLYGYNKFVEQSSSSKGVEFEAYQLAVLPHNGKAVFINYRDESTEANLSLGDSWTNTTVQSYQYINESFPSGTTNVTLILPGIDDSYSLTADRPRLISWMRMSSSDESWENDYVG